MPDTLNYAEEYIKYYDECPDSTWNDFFDYIDVSVKRRSDFLIGLILMQAREIDDRRIR